MGQGNTKVDNTSIKFIGEKKDLYLGKIKLYKAFHREQAVFGIKIQNPQVDVVLHDELRHQNLYEILTYDSNLQEIWFDQQGMSFYFEYNQQNLLGIIQDRMQRQQRFSEKEILRIILDLLSVLDYLHSNKVFHRNLHTKSIFYDPESKKMKVYNNELFFGNLQLYRKFWKKQQNQIGYATPETIKAVNFSEKFRYKTDFEILPETEENLNILAAKTDLFQLGCVLLETTTYLNSDDLFDWKKFQINFEIINQRIQIANSLYGEKIKFALNQMLFLEPEKRPLPFQLISQLKNFVSQENKPQEQSTQKPPILVNRMRSSSQIIVQQNNSLIKQQQTNLVLRNSTVIQQSPILQKQNEPFQKVSFIQQQPPYTNIRSISQQKTSFLVPNQQIKLTLRQSGDFSQQFQQQNKALQQSPQNTNNQTLKSRVANRSPQIINFVQQNQNFSQFNKN